MDDRCGISGLYLLSTRQNALYFPIRRVLSCAGWENRTPDPSLENSCFATKLIPRTPGSVARFRFLFISCRIVYARSMVRPWINVLALCIFAAGIFLFFQYGTQTEPVASTPQEQVSAVNLAASATTTSTTLIASTTPAKTSIPNKVIVQKPNNQAISTASTSTPTGEAVRIQNPYPTPPESPAQVNTDTRSALVNILCQPRGSSSLSPISGSGVLIDPRGIILTNAHVAQYVLLSESPEVDLECFVRTGSPAQAQWKAAVLYIPPVWVNAHASEILDPHPTGTGEHDYALLFITGSVNGGTLPSSFPYLPVDTREDIGFPGDQVLVASYPAEFVGGITAEYDLYSVSSDTTIKQLLTFETGSADLLSLGGVIEAQSGSSGGAVVNAWGRLIAIIATTSAGTTTADRDLRAVDLSYIDRDLAIQSGSDLETSLAGSPSAGVQSFTSNIAPQLIQQYIAALSQQIN
jgi:S1-C subfamily serine protease